MSASATCLTLFELFSLRVWQSLQSAEVGQLLTSLGGLLLIVSYLRKGAVAGGRVLAVILLGFIAVVLWGVVIYNARTREWKTAEMISCRIGAAPYLAGAALGIHRKGIPR